MGEPLEPESAELKRGRRLVSAATGLALPLFFGLAFWLFAGVLGTVADSRIAIAIALALALTVVWRNWVHTGAWSARLAAAGLALANAVTLIVVSERVNAFFFGVLVWCAAIAFILLGSRSARAYLDAQHAKREAQRPPRTQPSPKRVSPSGTVLDDVEELDARHSEPVATPDIEIPDWETAKPHLRMQLWHALRHLGAKAGLVTWIDIPRLWSALVYDAPELVIAVNPEQLAKWGVSRDEARKVAIANMIAMPIHETEKTMGSVSVRFLQAPYFAEGQALCLHARDLVGPAGTVFALPSQSVMIAHPVMGMDSLAAPPLMRELCGVIMREQPNPVSPEVYWYNDGKFAVFEMKEVDGQRGIELLADFAEAIDSLDRRRAPSELS